MERFIRAAELRMAASHVAAGLQEAARSGYRCAAQEWDVEGGQRVCGHATWDAARSIVLVERWLIVNCPRVSAPRKQRCTQAVVDCGRWVIIRTHAVGAPAVSAIATGGVGAQVEVPSERVQAAEHDGNALSGQRGRGVVVERGRVGTSLVKARAVLEGGQRAVVARVGLHASCQHRWAAAVIIARRRVEDLKAAVHAAALVARAVVHHGEDLVVQRRAGGAAVGWGRRGRRLRGRLRRLRGRWWQR